MKHLTKVTAVAVAGLMVATPFVGSAISIANAAIPRAQDTLKNLPPVNHTGRAAVVFYGLGDGIWSDGMKDIADRAGGKVYSWNKREDVQKSLIAAHRAGKIRYVVIAGHSLGGNSANKLGNSLVAAGVPVRCVATLDPTSPRRVDRRVGHAVNFISPDFRAKKVKGAKNIRRRDLNHVNMDNDRRIQAEVARCLA